MQNLNISLLELRLFILYNISFTRTYVNNNVNSNRKLVCVAIKRPYSIEKSKNTFWTNVGIKPVSRIRQPVEQLLLYRIYITTFFKTKLK